MKQKSYKKEICLIGMGILIIAILQIAFFHEDPLSIDFQGTYQSGNGPRSVYFSVDQTEGDVFFYADQDQEIYITGTIESISDHLYELVCIDIENQSILENQTILYQDKSFQIKVAGGIKEFQKINNIPIVFEKYE